MRDLHALGQQHLLKGLDALSPQLQQGFWHQMEQLPPHLLSQQQELVRRGAVNSASTIEPLTEYSQSGSLIDQKCGERLVREGKAGCLVLAGGQGTRLGFAGPKGMVPVSAIKAKSLFQMLAERTLAASRWAKRPLYLCIMTSSSNDAQTRCFFAENRYFGLEAMQVDFFVQNSLPFLDAEGNWLLQESGIIAQGPNGNGEALRLFVERGPWKKWLAAGIEYVSVMPVDNPLANPFDPELIGHQERTQAEVAMKVVERISPEENMGTIVKKNGKAAVVEYTELPTEQRAPFPLANANLFCFHSRFIQKIAAIDLPWHLAYKFFFEQWIWKFETFLFDLLEHSEHTAVLLFPRASTYSPLKNASGDKSLHTVQQALIAFDQQVAAFLTGKLSDQLIELDPSFYYLAQEGQKAAIPLTGYIPFS